MRSLLSPDTLREIVNAYADGASHAASARSAGVSPRVMWRWVAAAKANPTDPEYCLDFLGDGVLVSFDKCLSLSRRLMHLELRSRVEAENILGYTEIPTRFMGGPVWAPDPRTVNWSAADRIAFGFEADGLLRDPQGRCIEMTERRTVPWVQRLASLSHAFPDEFIPTTKTQSTILNLGTRGATRASEIGDDSGAPYVPPRPPLPELTVLPDEPDPELAELLGEGAPDELGAQIVEPEPADDVPDQVPTPAVEERIIKDIPPKDFIAPASKTLNPVLAALLTRR